MNSFPGSLPTPLAEIFRLDSPAAVPCMPAEPAESKSGRPVPPDQSTGSVLLAGLPPSVVLRAKLLQARKMREGSAASGNGETQGLRQHHADDFLYFGESARASSRQQSSGDDASRHARGDTRDPSSANFLQSAARMSRTHATHMAVHALELPALCEAHAASHGLRSMPAFLRKTMQTLVIDFTRDLADKIQHRARKETALRGHHAIQPVNEACDEFLRLMRPLYQRYVHAPSLYDDAREVLCAAQPLLQELLLERAGDNEFSRVMRSTICPLLPVLMMACVPRTEPRAIVDGVAA